jgi:1-acyl-sn-glycerol-3-phosphate acyltransferase
MRFITWVFSFLVSSYILLKQNDKSSGENDKIIMKKTLDTIYFLNKYILGIEQKIVKDSLLYLKDKVIITVNHQNYCDWMHVVHFLVNEGRYDINFICRKESVNTFLFGKFVERNLIWVERDYKKDIQNIKDQIHKLGDKFVLFIFPEGTFGDDPEYLRFSNDYMKMMNKPTLNYLLSPKYKGLQLLLENIEYDQIIDMTLIFEENYPKNHNKNIMATSYSSLLLDQYPQKCEVNIREIYIDKNNIKNDLLDIWIEKDKILKQFYDKNQINYANPYKKLARNIILFLCFCLFLKYSKKIYKLIYKINKINESNI